ncbi:hypothetical protein DS831_05510 [Bombilactobacillus bombi]|uniref:SHOCT domain-containing protein n=1 Tax=Bombilactobacillus bombi TaxID=1303590 RepID=A0A417ZEB3_9LACO|nr:SHOCT domain-containing protein [Bombilactobacillus bombi]RHW49620.1 hypothetical protein DS831_05510 [Bombilactobacillus bombi]
MRTFHTKNKQTTPSNNYSNYQNPVNILPQNNIKPQPLNQPIFKKYNGYFESGQLNTLNQADTFSYKRIWLTTIDYLIIIIGLIGLIASIWVPIVCLLILALRYFGIINSLLIQVNNKKIKITKDDYARLLYKKPLLKQTPSTINKVDIQLCKDISICQNSSFVNGTKMQQLYDNRIIFDRDNPIYYYLQGVSFEPKFKEEYVTSTTGTTKDNKRTVTKRKGKAGRTAAGGVFGKMLGGNTGALIGTAAGLSSGSKKTSQNSGGEKYNEQTIISTRQVEITSYAYISLYNINTKQFGQIVILAKTADFAVLKKFKIYHIENKHVVNNKPISQENLQLLQQLAQLRNQGIISPEEFEMKKQQLL